MNDDEGGLCLALAWDQTTTNDESRILDTRIVSSYSDGHVAIHKVQSSSSSSSSSPDEPISIELEHHWKAHSMFTSPAEVWCCSFVSVNGSGGESNDDNTPTNFVATGGDEGSWKLWDLRTNLNRPIHHGQNDFDAGVTILSPHPRHNHLLAVGSYDETIALFDLRYLSSSTSGKPTSLFHSESLGGGIWRCKWHPYQDNRLLVAAMHGGCRVIEFNHLGLEDSNPDSPPITLDIQQKFTKHKSMAYGADWLAYPTTSSNGVVTEYTEVAASCSFYDQAMYLWKTN